MKTRVLGIDPGEPRADALAGYAVLRLDEGTGTIHLDRLTVVMHKDLLPTVLESDPLLTDPLLRLVAVAAPLTPRPLESKPWKARAIEIRLSRGAFASAARGPYMPWISRAHSWPRYRQALPILQILQLRGFPLLVIPAEAPAAELPQRFTAEVFPKASLAVLTPRKEMLDRPDADQFYGALDDWLFPRLFTTLASTPPPILTLLEGLAPGLRLSSNTCEEARRIARLRRPMPRREPLRAFVAAFQGILALHGAACLVGAAGDHEGSLLLPATWHPDWDYDWDHPRRPIPELRRVPLGCAPRPGGPPNLPISSTLSFETEGIT